MAPPKSSAWQYFDKVADTKNAKCRSCFKVVCTSGNTTNLVTHLRQCHQALYQRFKNMSEQSKSNKATDKVSLTINVDHKQHKIQILFTNRM